MARGVEDSSGNVFADLGLPDAEEMLAKAKLASAIQDVIEVRGLNPRQASELMGVDQNDLPKITQGRLTDFSAERMLHFLIRLGLTFDIVMHKEAKPERHETTIRVACL